MHHLPAALRRYLLLLAIQTTGAAILFWFTVPLFRQAFLDPAGDLPRLENLVWSLSAITLMQAAFWIRHRLRPPIPQLRNALVGYIVLFVARMSFVLALSFWLRVIVRRPELFRSPMSRYFVLIVGLFALFCFHAGIRATGRALIGPTPAKRRASQVLTEVSVNFGLVRKGDGSPKVS